MARSERRADRREQGSLHQRHSAEFGTETVAARANNGNNTEYQSLRCEGPSSKEANPINS